MTESGVQNMTIYISNIPYSTDGKGLTTAFSRFGDIEQSRIISAIFRGKRVSRGFGFIDFKTVAGYNAALNCKEPIMIESNGGNRRLFVSPARPKVPHPKDTVFLGNLEPTTNEEDIKAAFQGREILEIRIPKARSPNATQKYFAFVKFATEDICKEVLAQQRVSIKGVDVMIRFARPPQRNLNRFGWRGRLRGRGRGRGRGRRGGRGRSFRGRRAVRRNPDQSTTPPPQPA